MASPLLSEEPAGSSGAVAHSEHAGQKDSLDDLVTQMSTVALLAAFMGSTALSLMTAVSKDEMVAADKMWADLDASVWRMGSSHSLSWMYTRVVGTTATLNVYTLVASVSIIMMSTGLQPSQVQQVRNGLQVLLITVYIGLGFATIALAPCFYWVGWIKQPQSAVEGKSWAFTGIWCMIASCIVWAYLIRLHAQLLYGGLSLRANPMHCTFYAVACIFGVACFAMVWIR